MTARAAATAIESPHSAAVKPASLTFINGWGLEFGPIEERPKAMLKRFLRDKSGATAIEYGLIVAVLSLAIVGGVEVFSNSMQSRFVDVANFLDEAN